MEIKMYMQKITLKDTDDEMINWLAHEIESNSDKAIKAGQNKKAVMMRHLFMGMAMAYLQTLIHMLNDKGIEYTITD